MIDLLTVALRHEQDIVGARQRARRIAALLGFDPQDQARIATAVSEIARNACRYARGGRVEFCLDESASPQQMITRVSDEGPGIARLEQILAGQYQSHTGMGLGIVGAQRLMDGFQIESAPGAGTRVRLAKALPASAPRVRSDQLARFTATLAQDPAQSPLEELQLQNQDLVRTLDALRRSQEDLVRLNRELEDTNRGVVALYAELDEKAEHLRRADEMKSRFLSNMSHEFRTPLFSTLALTQLLLDRSDGELTPEQDKQVCLIRRSAESLLEIVNDLLDIAKIEAGKIEIHSAPFQVHELFSALRGMLRPLLISEEVSLVFEHPSGVPALDTDEGKVSQILRNFISNALKFTERGEVRVAAALDAATDMVVFSVTDTGIGILPADQERIFEEFTQVRSQLQTRVKGTGLGLPLTRRLATLLGGRVEVSSVHGEGSTFRALLPRRYRGPVDASSDRVAAQAPAARTERPLRQDRALIVDDDAAARYLLRRWLDPARWEVHEAADGEAGVASARTLRPDVIFLDIGMPRMSGDAALRLLRTDPGTHHIPVVMVTAQPLTLSEREALSAIADAVVTKQELSAARIDEILSDALREHRA
jgi:signal transduction histidine kinase/CheY-like chemotaxis protein